MTSWIYRSPDDLDDDTLTKAAIEALEYPRDYAAWDERLYATHAPTIGWADRGDDLVEESNYHAALDMLNSVVAHTESDPGDVFDASASHWIVGSIRQIFVRVYTGPHFTCCAEGCDTDHEAIRRAGCTPWWVCDHDTHEVVMGDFTPAWREAVRIALALRDYPILDESDFSGREAKESDRQLDEAVSYEARRYDDGAEEAAIRTAFYDALGDDDEIREDILWRDYPNVDYDEVRALYGRVRDGFYAALAEECLRAIRDTMILPGQLALPGVPDA